MKRRKSSSYSAEANSQQTGIFIKMWQGTSRVEAKALLVALKSVGIISAKSDFSIQIYLKETWKQFPMEAFIISHLKHIQLKPGSLVTLQQTASS